MKTKVYQKNTQTPVPVLNWKIFILRKIELRNFQGNTSDIVFRVFDATNLNQPLKHYLSPTSFYYAQNMVMVTSLAAKNDPMQIPLNTKHLSFDIEIRGVGLFQGEYSVEYEFI